MAAEIKITAAASLDQLPDDVRTLKEMVLTLLGQIDDLEGQLYYLKRQLFGKKSEKLDPRQRLLFESLYNEVQARVEEQRQEKQNTEKPSRRANAEHPGRKTLPASLPWKTEEIEPAKEELVCEHCGSDKSRMGQDVTEKLEYVPASFYVRRYVRHKYVCKTCQNNISIGQLPTMVFEVTLKLTTSLTQTPLTIEY